MGKKKNKVVDLKPEAISKDQLESTEHRWRCKQATRRYRKDRGSKA